MYPQHQSNQYPNAEVPYDFPIQFTTPFYARLPENRIKCQVPLGVAVTPVTDVMEGEKGNVINCPRCGLMALGPCESCQNSVYPSNSTQATPLAMNIPIDNIEPVKTVIIFDNSSSARSFPFNPLVIESILPAIGAGVKNVAFACISTHLSILLPKNQIQTYPDPSSFVFPPSAFFETMPSSLNPLSSVQSPSSGPDILAAISAIANAIGEGGRIISFLAYSPSGSISFPRTASKDDGPNLMSSTFTQEIEEIYSSLRNLKIRLDFMILTSVSNATQQIAPLTAFASPFGGCIKCISPSEAFAIPSIVKEFIQTPTAKVTLRCTGGASLLPSLGRIQFNPLSFTTSSHRTSIFQLNLPPKFYGDVFVQADVTTTFLDGTRRRQVYTRKLYATDDISLVFKAAKSDVVLKYLTNMLLSLFYSKKVTQSTFSEVALALLKPIFLTYRLYVSTKPNRLQNLVFPVSLQHLPLYLLGILKSTAFTPGLSFNERSVQLQELEDMHPSRLVNVAYPKLYDITEYVSGTGERIPYQLREVSLRSDKLMLLDTGFSTFLWIGKKIDSDLCASLFAKRYPTLIEQITPIDSEESARLFALVKGGLRFFVEGGPGLQLILDRMIEDSTSTHVSYEKWMQQLNKVCSPNTK